MKAARILIMQCDVESRETASEEMQQKLDDFRESTQPSTEHGIQIVTATRGDLEMFSHGGCLLPNPGILTSEEYVI